MTTGRSKSVVGVHGQGRKGKREGKYQEIMVTKKRGRKRRWIERKREERRRRRERGRRRRGGGRKMIDER